ncbi:MAG TPA: peptide-methionine (S)-S-oxide reductase MsrA [Kofleriaceae bacterium]|nr:peptide-methionine (S)-S-oxide reductase MsrA [Kofleriaceae bacterium]
MMRFLALTTIATAIGLACTPTESHAGDPSTQAAKQPAKPDGPREVAILGAGCFWGVEHWMNKASGIVDIEVGYAGGKSSKTTYAEVSSGKTGHAEVVRIVFDPSVISYDDLLAKWFFRIHDPTTRNQQGNDIGTQYRSAIFPTTEHQKQVAEQVLARVERSGKWKKPITTTIEPNPIFVRAEDYHQDYLVKHPGGYDNHFLRDFTF